MIKFEDQLTGQLCECDACYSDEYTWDHLNLFEKRGLKIELGDVVTGEMLLKILNIQEDLFRCLHHFRPKRLEELCLARLNEQEKKKNYQKVCTIVVSEDQYIETYHIYGLIQLLFHYTV